MYYNSEALRHELAHVYWLGGSPCSGKSSIADSLAEKYGLHIYRCDEAFYVHEKLITCKEQPTFYRLTHLSSEELWMRPVEQQTVEEISFYREEFPLIIKDLLALSKSMPILAEGAALLPELVCSLLLDRRRTLWVVHTPAFQLYHCERRAWAWDVVKECKNPAQAFSNWMQRDIGFARFVTQEAGERGMSVLQVDGKLSLAENMTYVEQYFQLRC